MSGFATQFGAPGDAGRKPIGVVLSEIYPATVNRQRDQQYA